VEYELGCRGDRTDPPKLVAGLLPLALLLPQHVPNATHGVNQTLFVVFFELEAQVANVDFDDIGITPKIVTPDAL